MYISLFFGLMAGESVLRQSARINENPLQKLFCSWVRGVGDELVVAVAVVVAVVVSLPVWGVEN